MAAWLGGKLAVVMRRNLCSSNRIRFDAIDFGSASDFSVFYWINLDDFLAYGEAEDLIEAVLELVAIATEWLFLNPL